MIPLGLFGAARPRAAAGEGYIATALALGAVTVMDGFTDAVIGQPYAVHGPVAADGFDPHGHAVARSSSTGYLSTTVVLERSFTFCVATLSDGGTSPVSRLIDSRGFLGTGAARTITNVARHTFPADPGVWKFLIFASDEEFWREVTRVYRDGALLGEITQDQSPNTSIGTGTITIGGNAATDRHTGAFAAAAVFPTALTPEQVAELYAAYLTGP